MYIVNGCFRSPLKVHRIEALELFDTLTKRGPGGDNNPYGRSGKPEETNVDNIHVDIVERPSGTSAQAGLRRLAKAAEAGDEKAITNLTEVREARKSVNAACVDMGWRPAKIDKDVRDRAAQALAERIVANVAAPRRSGLHASPRRFFSARACIIYKPKPRLEHRANEGNEMRRPVFRDAEPVQERAWGRVSA